MKKTAYVQRYGDLVGTIVRPALRDGKVLYATPPTTKLGAAG